MMKKIIMIMALVACTSMQALATDDIDVFIEKASTHESDSTEKKLSLSIILGVGPTVMLDSPQSLDIATSKSWGFTFGLGVNYHPKKESLQIYSIGLALSTQNFGTKTKGMLVKEDNGLITLTDYPEGSRSRHSFINVFSASVPILFTQRFSKKGHVSFSVGPVINFNTADLNNNYSIGDSRYQVSTDHIGCRPVTVDVMGILSVYGVGIYCKYSPTGLFKSKSGLDSKTLSFGICL